MRMTISYYLYGLTLLMFVLVNVYASQLFHPLFYKITINPDVPSAGQFLAEIQGSPYYEGQKAYLNEQFNNIFQRQLLQQKYDQDSQLKKYEEILKKNPNSRDALVSVALIHFQKEDIPKAKKYYSEAKMIDPWLKIDVLEEANVLGTQGN